MPSTKKNKLKKNAQSFLHRGHFFVADMHLVNYIQIYINNDISL